MAQVQIISGVERRRRWSGDQKRAIVAAAFAPGAVVAEVARRADINTGLIYRWRQEQRDVSQGFAEVVVSSVSGGPADRCGAVIEVAIGGNTHVRIAASSPPALAAAVVKALSGR